MGIKHSNPKFKAGLIGHGIQASLTPRLHMQEGKRLGLNYTYDLFDLKTTGVDLGKLPDLMARAAASGYVGLNITHPCKQVIIPFLDDLSEDARVIGAMNTVLLRDGRMIGHNTDWWGFAESFKRGLATVALDSALLLGAGGAGAALAYASHCLGIKRLFVFDLAYDRAINLVKHCNQNIGFRWAESLSTLPEVIGEVNGIIQATPVGMNSYPSVPFDANLLLASHWMAEIIYTPLETELLRLAKVIGCQTLNGMGMTVLQAAKTFQLFTGLVPDVERMEQHFIEMQKH
jgi:shikimate dehydrogenase